MDSDLYLEEGILRRISMRTGILKGLVLSFALFASFLGFSGPAIAGVVEGLPTPDVSEVVTRAEPIAEVVVTGVREQSGRETAEVAQIMEYKVRWGDTLHTLSRRYNTSVEELVSSGLNPHLAARGNPDLIFVGEKILVPVYEISSQEFSTLAPEELVVLPAHEVMALDASLQALAVTQAENTSLKENEEVLQKEKAELLNEALALEKQNIASEGKIKDMKNTIGILVTVFVLILVFLYAMLYSKKARSSLTGESPEYVLAALRTVDGGVLVAVNDMAITHDERGNAVTLKKLGDFIDKRPQLRDVPVQDWNLGGKPSQPSTGSGNVDG